MSAHRRTSERADDQPRHRAPRKPRLRIVLSGAAAVAVVSGGTAFACIGGPGHHVTASPAGHSALPAGWHPSQPHTAAPAHQHHHRPQPTASATPSPAPTRTTAPPTAPPTTTPAPTPSATPAPASPTPTAPAAHSATQQVLDLINKARAAQGLAPYKLLDGLVNSATAHNQVMAGGCGLSHQCPGESPIGDRETAAGVHWNGAGENIGVGGPVADNEQAIADMALRLTQGMLDEKAPDDGHRRNILSSGFTYVGIAVERDSSGSVWLTQDFASTF
jgi:uncharacterized protein YkwD